jgi:L-seryl-tRNA(Ser) seleniumtransferase
VDALLREAAGQALVARHGHTAVVAALRQELGTRRQALRGANGAAVRLNKVSKEMAPVSADELLAAAAALLEARARPSLRPVFNLTGTILHTNLGRAVLPPEAIEAVRLAAAQPGNLEYDLVRGERGERDDHVERLLCALTGGEAATVVNNNAAAVLLVLNSLALRKEVPVSRGELIEIGGSFRLPEIMARAGCKLREVGTTNRTHLRDYAEALGPKTGALMKVHPSNYRIEGFTRAVPVNELAKLCSGADLPLIVDLGSGSLVDLREHGLPHETTVRETLALGAHLATFSGDKLLGGPQAGLIVGRADLIGRIRRNPLKRALRVDKMTMAALAAVLSLYAHPETLAERLPTLRLLTRPRARIAEVARGVVAPLAARLAGVATVEVVDCESEIGSGALPATGIPSAGVAITPLGGRRGGALDRLTAAFRRLPVPVIGRVHKDSFLLDCRALEDVGGFLAQLDALRLDADASEK